MKNIAKKIATVTLAFALALGSVFVYNPLVVNATSSSDLALDFVNEVTVTKPHTLAVYYQEDLTDSYAITEIVIESNYPMRFYASGSFFSAVINPSYGVWKEFLNLSSYTDIFSNAEIGVLMYKTSVYNKSTNQLISEDNHIGFNPFGNNSDSYFKTISRTQPNKIVSNSYVYTNLSSAQKGMESYVANSTKVDLSNSIVLSFDDYGAKTSTAPSSYTADASLIGEGVLVSVPAVMDLAYSEENDAYIASDYISAKGHVLDIAEVVVSTEKTAEYSLLDTNKTYEANVSFGSDMGDKNVAIWSASDLNAGFQNANNVVKKPIAISLSGGELEWAGDYKSILEVDVRYNVVGLYRDLCEPSGSTLTLNQIEGSSYKYTIADNQNRTNWNMNGFSTFSTVPTHFLEGTNNTTVEKIQLAAKDADSSSIFYTGNVSKSDPNTITSWLKGCNNVQLVIVPETITALTICSYYNPSNDVTTSADYRGVYFTGTDIEIGNALSFVKGVTDGGYYEYVPYIVFRGTMDEWKAIPGNGDWVFGNAANTVTVQCTDGRLLYN